MVRHLAGAGIGLVAVPVLLLLSWWSLREQQLFAGFLQRGHGVLFFVSFLFLGAVVGVLCGARFVSPVASLVAGGLLFLLSVFYWLPFVLRLPTLVDTGSWLGRAVGYTPMVLTLSAVLLVASAWPSRWRTAPQAPHPHPQPQPHPRPFPGPEVRP